MEDVKLFLNVFLRKIILLLVLFLFMFLDSYQFAQKFEHGFQILNVLAVIAIVFLIKKSSLKLRQLIFCYILAALVIEYYFSLYLKAYTYQRIYIPLYVLFGHAIIYERLYTFTKKPIVLQYKSKLHVVLSVFIIALATYSYVVKDDLFGFCLSVLFFVLVFLVKPARTYFLMSYIVLAILELLGVYFKCWTWIDSGFGFFDFMPSANPPIGIPICYFLITLLTYLLYFIIHPKVWQRFQKRVRFNAQLINVSPQKGLK